MKNQLRYLQHLFYELLNDYGQVYVVVRHSDKSVIGQRGFTKEEKEKGLVLVFNERNNKDLQWREDGSISATLGFGGSSRPEKCLLHSDDIVSIFSARAKIRFERWDMWDSDQPEESVPEEKKSQGKIVSLDHFRKTKA